MNTQIASFHVPTGLVRTILLASVFGIISLGFCSRAHALEPSQLKASARPSKGDKAFGLEVGGGLGMAYASTLGMSPEISLRFGGHYQLSSGTFAVLLEGGYQYYSFQGSGAKACVNGNDDACVESNGGAYDWSARVHLGRVSLPLAYRMTQLASRWEPEIVVSPGVYFSRSFATSFELTNSQFATSFGFSASAGTGYRIGPGAVQAMARYQWVPLRQKITGEVSTHAVGFLVGYRMPL